MRKIPHLLICIGIGRNKDVLRDRYFELYGKKNVSMRGIKKKKICIPSLLCDPVEYHSTFSRGVRVDLVEATILFISGTASIDKNGRSLYRGDFTAQLNRTLENITALLNSENAGWRDVVQTRCYIKDMRYYDKLNEIRSRFYKQQKLPFFPASVCVEARLCRPELLVEIEAIAIFKTVRKGYPERIRNKFRKED